MRFDEGMGVAGCEFSLTEDTVVVLRMPLKLERRLSSLLALPLILSLLLSVAESALVCLASLKPRQKS